MVLEGAEAEDLEPCFRFRKARAALHTTAVDSTSLPAHCIRSTIRQSRRQSRWECPRIRVHVIWTQTSRIPYIKTPN